VFSIIVSVSFAVRSYALQSNRNDAELHIELAARRLYNTNLHISTQGRISPTPLSHTNCLQAPP